MIIYLIIISIINCFFLAVFGLGILTVLGMWGNSEETQAPVLLMILIILTISVILPWILHHLYKSLENQKRVILKWLSIFFSLIPLVLVIFWYAFNFRTEPEILKRPEDINQNIEEKTN